MQNKPEICPPKHAINLMPSQKQMSNDFNVGLKEVPIRRFTPLPDIPRVDDAYFRTESYLIQTNPVSKQENDDRPAGALPMSTFLKTDESRIPQQTFFSENGANKIKIRKNETRYHFVQKKTNVHRLPALEKNTKHNLHQAMDLDEDLPINPINTSNLRNQRVIYTSPGDRIISPIKRPPAPSPPASTSFRREEKNSDSDTESSL